MTLSLIVAMTEERVIGRDNQLPWRLPEDLKRFKKITMGHALIMGRKTYDSIGRPLPGRENIVITRDRSYKGEGIRVVYGLEEALQWAEQLQKEPFIIGGAEIFRLALPRAERLFLTYIHQTFEGDTYFPEFDLEKDFEITEKIPGQSEKGDPIPYTFITAHRK